jgi:catechol-2,3-dioxygenase
MTRPVPVVSDIGHLAVRVRDVEAAVREATELIGLRVAQRDGDSVLLTHGIEHHSLRYIEAGVDAVDHVGFRAAGPEALSEIRDRVSRARLTVVSEDPLSPGVLDGFAFVAHDGFTYEVYSAMEQRPAPAAVGGVGPVRLGHVTFNVPDPAASRDVLLDLLDFRVTDVLDGIGSFLRCNVDHHAVGMLNGTGVLHHHAWEVQSIADLGRLGDLLEERGRSLVWGPVRHGAGRNIAAYYTDAAGAVVELYCDMERIYDEEGFVPRTWPTDDHRWYSLWAPLRPPASEFRQYGLGPAAHTGG